MKRTPLISCVLAALVLVIAGCTALAPLNPVVQNAPAAIQQAQDAAVKQRATLDPTGQIAALEGQISALTTELAKTKAVATTQPALSPEVVALQVQVDALKKQLASMPNADAIDKLNGLIADLQKSKTIASTVAVVSPAVTNPTPDNIGKAIDNVGPLTNAIPVYGPYIALGLSIIGLVLKQRQATAAAANAAQANADADNIVTSISAAAQAGHLTITPQGVGMLRSIQTKSSKARIDAVQNANGQPSVTGSVTGKVA
jgi:hypothetical protein